MSLRIFARTGLKLLEIYNHQAKTRPLTTMSVTTGVSMVKLNHKMIYFKYFFSILILGYWKLFMPNDSKKND